MKFKALSIIAAGILVVSANVNAEEHVIKAAVTKYIPMVVYAKPGDTITWTNMAGHDTASLNGMIPEGAEAWHSTMGENYSITVEKEGAYIYKCTPHVSLGMLGAIVVNNADNLEAIKESVDGSGEPKGMVNRTIRNLEKSLAENK
jgi:pseudoazurin